MTGLLLTLGLFVLGWWVGRTREQAHLQSLDEREQALSAVTLITCRRPPADWAVQQPELVSANVVISWDYFKAVVSGLHMMVGGTISTLEPLLVRARREAVVRLKERAAAAGYDGVIGLRLETSRMTNAAGGSGLGGIEILAYGTAVRRS